MEDPPITWEAVQEWGQIIEPVTAEELALFDPPLLRQRSEQKNTEQEDSFQIRRFQAGDREHIQDIRKRAFAPIYDSWRELLGKTIFDRQYPDADPKQAEYLDSICGDHSTNEVYVLQNETHIVGFVGISFDEDGLGGEITLNAVDPEFQGRGLGTQLYAFAVARLKEKGVTLARVGTALDAAHAPARKAYEKAGFSVGLPYIALFQLL